MDEVFTDLCEYGIKKTRQRLALLRIMESADKPLSAATIHALCLEKDRDAWLSTTYRTLDMFTEKGIINKTIPLEEENAVYELNRHEHRHYAVCKGCQKMMDIECCPIGELQIKTKEGAFHMTGHRLEVYGYCEECFHKQK
jgi:Fe2+ or Zn2+ uptake regulation protein